MATQTEHTPAEAFVARRFDYIVVGGGTAGLAVAVRLAENPALTVGVLEAGDKGDGIEDIDIPGYSGRSLGGPLDWRFETVPQPGLGGRKIPWNRGKVVGGSSALNFMTWNRASKEDYDAWEELGNPGWGWESLLPYFKKSETFHPPPPASKDLHQTTYNGPSEFLGKDGPINVSYTRDFSPSHAFWHATLNELGIPSNPAHVSGNNVGVWTTICSINAKDSTRSYAAHYLRSKPSNLHVLTQALAQEVILDKSDPAAEWTATGVRFTHGNGEFVASVSREVILSGGSVNSPQLLELSGIGNPEVLSAAGIRVKVDLPKVGENLQEHIMLPLIFEVDPKLPQPEDLLKEEIAAIAYKQYKTEFSGPLSMLPCSMAYLPVSRLTSPEAVKDLFSRSEDLTCFSSDHGPILVNRFAPNTQLGQVEFAFDLGRWNPSFAPDPATDKRRYGSMMQMLQYPFSRGSIHIRASDDGSKSTASVPPVIDPQYYTGAHGELDFEIMMHGVKFAQKICSTKPLSNIVRGPVEPPASAVKTMDDDDEELREWIVKNTVTDWHPVGTCSMGGRAGREAGVVDHRLRVYGVRALRVVDASVMPLHISAHLQSTVYAIAEKAADMILEDLAHGGGMSE
ncbi:putative GMC oxidoreductase [Cladorrhinum sp. PSN259]|nr:putative GMC oxidoreductase [Cladorrhinum sp. PSN259]